jgi:hypothetical protein
MSASGAATGDSLAIALALQIEDAAGGKTNWDKIRFIRFDYFGSRLWFWDKFENRYRVESEKRNFRIAGTLDGQETFLWLDGNIVTEKDSLKKYQEFAFKTWINDTYWLILPFKLNDPGVNLTYAGTCMTDANVSATCIELTFNDVGVTPDNKYRIYIDTLAHQIIHWDYFRNKTDTLPTISNSWTEYQTYGNIVLSSGRGDRSFSDIRVFEALPNRIFSDVSVSAKEIIEAEDALLLRLLK